MMSFETWTTLAFQGGGLRDLGSMILPIAILAIFYLQEAEGLPGPRGEPEEGRPGGHDRGACSEVVSVDGPTVILKIADTVKGESRQGGDLLPRR